MLALTKTRLELELTEKEIAAQMKMVANLTTCCSRANGIRCGGSTSREELSSANHFTRKQVLASLAAAHATVHALRLELNDTSKPTEKPKACGVRASDRIHPHEDSHGSRPREGGQETCDGALEVNAELRELETEQRMRLEHLRSWKGMLRRPSAFVSRPGSNDREVEVVDSGVLISFKTARANAIDCKPCGEPQLSWLLASAEGFVRASARLNDYRLPFSSLSKLPLREAADLFDRACRLGHAPACWKVNSILSDLHSDDENGHAIRSNCRRGDFMSCRADPVIATGRTHTGEMHGKAGRNVDCYLDHHGCDHPALRRECERGFPDSCVSLALSRETPADSGQLLARGLRLAQEGCELGIRHECRLPYWREIGPAEWRPALRSSCRYNVFDCMKVGALEFDENNPVMARELLERSCQQGLPDACIIIAFEYVRGTIAEPVPDRGRDLLHAQCPLAVYGDLKEDCKRYLVAGTVTWETPLERGRAHRRASNQPTN